MRKNELDLLIERHNEWLKNGSCKKLDCSCLEMSKTDLRGKNLRFAVFYQTNLHGADLCCAKMGEAVLRYADLRHTDMRLTDLHNADLRHADLRSADLRGAILRGADLREANLSVASLFNADLNGANLCGANLYGASLAGANLYGANLRDANLVGANIDYAVWPLSCKSLKAKIDKRIAAQLLYHTLRAMKSCEDVREVAAVLASEPCLELANKFHLAGECGIIERVRKYGERNIEKGGVK